MKNKKTKKIIVIAMIVVLVICAIAAALIIIKNVSKGTVAVYDASNFTMTDYYEDDGSVSGTVTMEDIQKVYVSSTQKVDQIYVKEGDSVKAGDVLVQLDTTLTEIDLEKAQEKVAQYEIDISKAQSELQTINNLQPHGTVTITPDNSGISFISRQTPMIVSGSGTYDDPVYVLYDGDTIDDELLEKLFSYSHAESETEDTEIETEDTETETENAETESSEGSEEENTEEYSTGKEVYVAFVTRNENALNGEITSKWGLCLKESDSGFSMSYYEPVLSEEIQKYDEYKESYEEDTGSEYTSAEIAQMRNEKEAEIAKLKNEYELAKVDLKKVESEVNESTVTAKIDGTVKTVRDADTAATKGTALIEVSAGGGYIINAVCSELSLPEEGQSVTVKSWENDISCEGTVQSVDTYPADESGTSSGNTNVSYYPVKIFVSEEENLEDGSYVTITYVSQESSEESIYLDKMFILSEDGKNYVYAADEDGILRKRQIKTGKTIWGSYTQVFSGVSTTDRLAFPYGNDVKDGAHTEDGDISSLYSY